MVGEIALTAVGALALLFVSIDVVWTTLTLDTAGPLARTTATLCGAVVLRIEKVLGWSWLRSVRGPSCLLATMMVWLALIWAGWYAIFVSWPGAVVASDTGLPADHAETAYFLGFNMVTLGIGDYVPSSAIWQFLTVCCAVHGFFLITLAITYMLPVVQSVVKQRKLALTVTALGDAPDHVLRLAYDKETLDDLVDRLSSIGDDLAELDRLFAAYPVLAYFDARHRREATPVAVGLLVDVVLLLDRAVAPELRPSELQRRILLITIDRYLNQALDAGEAAGRTDYPTASFDLGPIPTASEDEVKHALQNSTLRGKATAYLDPLGWSWDDVYAYKEGDDAHDEDHS